MAYAAIAFAHAPWAAQGAAFAASAAPGGEAPPAGPPVIAPPAPTAYVPLPPLMRVLKPLLVTDAMLISSNVVDDPAPAWSAGAAYASGAAVQHAHRRYESLQAGNVGHLPGSAVAAAWWLDLGPTTRWAMFDQSVGTSSSAGGVLQVVLQPGEVVNALALVGAGGYEASLSMRTQAGDVVYARTLTIGGSSGASFYDYFFGDHETAGDLVFDQLPPYFDATISVSITAPVTASCGVLLIGKLHDIGGVEYGVDVGIADYSIKSTDDFGTATLLQRDFAREASFPIVLPKADIRRVHTLLSSLRATPCLWVGNPDTEAYGPLAVYGWFSDFRLVVSYPTSARMTLDVQGLT